MITRADLMERIALFEKYLRIAPTPRGMRQTRMREIIRGNLDTIGKHNDANIASDVGVLTRIVGIALGVGFISESQMTSLDSRYAA